MKKDGKYLFTSESVGEGHPDKVADQVSDSILDAILCNDPKARVDAETLVMEGTVMVTGQITTKTYVNIPNIVRNTLKEIGLDNAKDGLDWETCGVLVSFTEQSPDISMGVTEKEGHEQGAGDQGMVFGYATNETKELMPLPIMLAHKLVKRLADVRKQKIIPCLRPDCKSQVTVQYNNGMPECVMAVVIAAQNNGRVDDAELKKEIIEKVIKNVIPANMLRAETKYIINGTGRFVPRRNPRRLRLNRQKNNRRHLRRRRKPRRRMLQRQRPVKSRPQRLLHGTLHRQKHRRCGTRRAMRNPNQLRHRRCPANQRSRKHVRHW